MRCLYKDIECDWPESTGDIECAQCVHYNEGEKSASKGGWLKKLLNKILTKK